MEVETKKGIEIEYEAEIDSMTNFKVNIENRKGGKEKVECDKDIKGCYSECDGCKLAAEIMQEQFENHMDIKEKVTFIKDNCDGCN